MSKLRGFLFGSGEFLRKLRREAAGVTGVVAERCRRGSESAECVWSGAVWIEPAECVWQAPYGQNQQNPYRQVPQNPNPYGGS